MMALDLLIKMVASYFFKPLMKEEKNQNLIFENNWTNFTEHFKQTTKQKKRNGFILRIIIENFSPNSVSLAKILSMKMEL